MSESVVRAHVWVSGRVQGVWFRQSTAERAMELGIGGWVRNLEDGRVEAVFEGSPVAVADAVAYVRTGPDRARVDDVEIAYESPAGEVRFSVR